MRPLLITLLTGCLAMNLAASVLMDGTAGVALNVASGVGVVAAGVGLWLTREKQEA